MDYNEIHLLLQAQRLAEVFPAVREKASAMGNWEVAEDVENRWLTYRQMLQFMLQGANDSHSQQIRAELCHSLRRDVSRLERLERLKNNTSEKYVSTRKELKNVPSFESLAKQLEAVSADMTEANNDELLRDSIRQHRLDDLEKTHETLLLQLFNWTWTSEQWQNSDTEQASAILFSDHISSIDKAVFIGAVTLSLLEFADTAKTLFLLDAYLAEDQQVAQRALVGMVLTLYLHHDRLADNRELLDRLAVYREDPAFIHAFYSAMMQLQLSCTTDSVTSKMRNDIIPTLMQGQMRRAQEEKPIDLQELNKNGENPEWTDDAKVDQKMREMAELQLSGADIYYSSFAMLKGYAFFGPLPHWFYPFSFNHILVPELKQLLSGRIGRFMRLMLSSSPFCNSDKYSLCFTFKTLGSMGEAAVEAQINRQLDGENVDELLDDAEQTKSKPADIRRQYIFDLYRFFHSYPYKQQFVNPFALLKEKPVTPHSNPLLSRLLGDATDDMVQYADFLMRKSFYAAALQIFDSLPKNEFEDRHASLWQKIGFCHQKLDHPDEAIRAYTVADSLKPSSKWTLSHLASLCAATGRNDDAARLYQALLQLHPDSTRYLLATSQALLLCDRFDEAQPLLYKLVYLDEETLHKRLLAWCLLACGERDKTAALLGELLQDDHGDKDGENLMLQAILLLVDRQPRQAYDLLRSIMLDAAHVGQLRQRLRTLSRRRLLDKTTVQLFLDAVTLNID